MKFGGAATIATWLARAPIPPQLKIIGYALLALVGVRQIVVGRRDAKAAAQYPGAPTAVQGEETPGATEASLTPTPIPEKPANFRAMSARASSNDGFGLQTLSLQSNFGATGSGAPSGGGASAGGNSTGS